MKFLLLLGCFICLVSSFSLNPFKINERKEIAELLLNSTKLDSLFDEDNSGNYFHGTFYQFMWQNLSGRIISDENGTITNNWWSTISFYSIMVPFLSAKQSNLISDSIHPRIKQRDPTEFQILNKNSTKLFNLWGKYFTQLQIFRNETIKEEKEKFSKLKHLGKLWWKSYVSTVQYAVSISKEKLDLLCENEKIYIQAWLQGLLALQHETFVIFEEIFNR
jgi:hypothetical protein